jgi:hypothetical protein
MTELLDDKGLLHAKFIDQARPLLDCWTRCRAMADRVNCKCWNRKAERQFRRFLRNVLRLTRRDGTLVFSEPSSNPCGKRLATALSLVGGRKEKAIASRLFSEKKSASGGRADLPSPAVHSEWAATAVLRSDWSRSAPRLSVLYPKDSCRVELARGRDLLASGQWLFDLSIDGRPVEPTADWTELCWVSDEDVDYLEMEMILSEGFRIQRHFLLARKELFLFLADSVLGPRRAALEYRGRLPLHPDAAFREGCEARQGEIIAPHSRTRIVPLALPEHAATRPAGATGALLAGDGTIELRQSAEGQSLFAPLFFDLSPKRLASPIHYRRLTVAESWTVAPDDVAVGYRVAIARRQWLFYRSLARQGNRSLLGHNISSEMLAARFRRNGEVESLIEIE